MWIRFIKRLGVCHILSQTTVRKDQRFEILRSAKYCQVPVDVVTSVVSSRLLGNLSLVYFIYRRKPRHFSCTAVFSGHECSLLPAEES
jgi:hypothetical protein